MSANNAEIQIDVDVANPGQFFACCGLLELADRLWKGAEGWFNGVGNEFYLRPSSPLDDAKDLLQALAKCELKNTMKPNDRTRFEELNELRKKDMSKEMEDEKKLLDKLERELPLTLGSPFCLQLDWFRDNHSGGSRFKTWAGQQSVIKIAQAMKEPLEKGQLNNVPPKDWLYHTSGDAVSFNLDADLGSQSSALDVGFSLDPLKMSSGTRPLLELAAFIGLQRFRPTRIPKANSHTYDTWTDPASPQTAAVAVSGFLCFPESRRFAFPLMFRTKYLKSFLPAQPFVR